MTLPVRTTYGQSALDTAELVKGCTGVEPLANDDEFAVAGAAGCRIAGHAIIFTTLPDAASQRAAEDLYSGQSGDGFYAEGTGYIAFPESNSVVAKEPG